jgi:prepilin-type N-terminal cleavage/methylation domain-containing protein
MNTTPLKKGLTLIEMLIVIAVLVFLTAGGLRVFGSFNESQNLDKSAAKIRGLLEEARSLTLASKGDMQYGVHLETGKAVLYQGPTYNASASSNVSITFPSKVSISNITLTGGGSDVLFSRVTGTVSSYGTTTLSLLTSSSTKALVVYRTGLVEIK